MCRRVARDRSRQRFHARLDAGLCARCGKHPTIEGGTVCEPCHEQRREAERQIYATGPAAGKCGGCDVPAFNGVERYAPCTMHESGGQDRQNAASRRRYAERRANGLCTDCGKSSQGGARCEPCAERSYFRSDHFRGLPL